MAIQHIIAALVDDWDRVNGLLDETTRAELRRHVTTMADALTNHQRRTTANTIVRLLLTRLPDDDPVLVVDDRPIRGFTGLAEVDFALLTLAGEIQLYVSGGRTRTADDRILSARWEAASELRRRGVDPDVPDLIRLDRPDGGYAVPAFQFDEHDEPISVVLRCNQLLDARHDPWGAADWWLCANVWLRDPPSALLGHTPDDLLVAAAVAAVEG